MLGLVCTSGLAAWAAAMFAFPSALRPVMPLLINGIAVRAGIDVSYSDEHYTVWSWSFVALAAISGTLFVALFIHRPIEDRRIDAMLRNRSQHTVRGAPTEPP